MPTSSSRKRKHLTWQNPKNFYYLKPNKISGDTNRLTLTCYEIRNCSVLKAEPPPLSWQLGLNSTRQLVQFASRGAIHVGSSQFISFAALKCAGRGLYLCPFNVADARCRLEKHSVVVPVEFFIFIFSSLSLNIWPKFCKSQEIFAARSNFQVSTNTSMHYFIINCKWHMVPSVHMVPCGQMVRTTASCRWK